MTTPPIPAQQEVRRYDVPTIWTRWTDSEDSRTYVLATDHDRVVASLAAENAQLREALKELIEAESAQMPAFDAGNKAQAKWADRCAEARYKARAALTPAKKET